MTMLSINHGAKGIIMWTFPTTPELTNWTSQFAKAIETPIASFVLRADILPRLTVKGAPTVDASAWIIGDWMLLSIINPSHEDVVGPVVLVLPAGFRSNGMIVPAWGEGKGWLPVSYSQGGFNQLKRTGLPGFNVDIFFLLREGSLIRGSSMAEQSL